MARLLATVAEKVIPVTFAAVAHTCAKLWMVTLDAASRLPLKKARGRPYTSDGFRSLWHRAMAAAKLAHPEMPRWTFHDLRAKAGSESRDWRLLGHMDQRTFERVYNRLPRQVSPTR